MLYYELYLASQKRYSRVLEKLVESLNTTLLLLLATTDLNKTQRKKTRPTSNEDMVVVLFHGGTARAASGDAWSK
jgi:hypothetical protein